MMLREIWKGILDFRLIDPGFDGGSELSEMLGLRGRKPTPRIPTPDRPVAPVDETTKRMIQYLNHEIDEDPEA